MARKNLLPEKGRKSETGQAQLTSPARNTTFNIHRMSRLQTSSYENDKISEQLNHSKIAFDMLKRSPTVCLTKLLFEKDIFISCVYPICCQEYSRKRGWKRHLT